MRDVWSDDPDRTTRRGDTRTAERVTRDTFPCACEGCKDWRAKDHAAQGVGRLIDLIIGSGKAWDVAREAGLTVLEDYDSGGYVVTLYGQPGTRLPMFADLYATQSDAYRAVLAYLARPR